MSTLRIAGHSLSKWARWIARLFSLVTAGFWLMIWLDILVCDALGGYVCLDWESVLFAVIVVISAVCVVIAWQWEWIGAHILVIWGAVFSVIAFVTSSPQGLSSALVTGVPLLISGCLFFLSWQLDRSGPNNKITEQAAGGL